MSLINEALKKAQRARNEGSTADAPPVPGGGGIAKRGQPRSATTIAMIVVGAVALVIVSVVGTVYLLSRKPAAAPAPAVASATPTPATSSSPIAPPPTATAPSSDAPVTPVPVVTTPVATAPVTKSPESIAPAPAPTSPADKPAAPRSSATITPVATTPPPPIAPTTTPPTTTSSSAVANAVATPARPDERVTAYVESVKVTGIRSTGTDGRALMNGQVYRVNQIVERTLGVRLVKVEVDSLTFADANGVTYVKYF